MKFIKNFEISCDCHDAWKRVKNEEIKGFLMSITDDLGSLVLEEIIENDGKREKFNTAIQDRWYVSGWDFFWKPGSQIWYRDVSFWAIPGIRNFSTLEIVNSQNRDFEPRGFPNFAILSPRLGILKIGASRWFLSQNLRNFREIPRTRDFTPAN